MKKLIAIAVVFALVAGAAFADTSVSGTIDTRLNLVDAVSNDPAKWPASGGYHPNEDGDGYLARTGGSVADGYIQLSGQDDDGKIGGLVRIRENEQGGNFHRAFVWWQPLSQLRVFLGHDLDGKFGTDPLTSWGFHQGGEGFLNRHDWGFWRSVYPGNWDAFGLALSVYPAPGVQINLVVPTGDTGWYPGESGKAGRNLDWDKVLPSLRLQSEIGIPDIGKIYFSWIGPENKAFDDIKDGPMGNIGLSFLLTAIDGFQIHPAFSVDVPEGEYDSPVRIGLAVHYAGGDFGVKFRSAFVINKDANEDKTFVTFNVMPWFNAGILRAFFDIGADINADKNADDPAIYFWINPYIRKSIGPGAINAGIRVEIDAPNPDVDAAISFKIPVQFVFSF